MSVTSKTIAAGAASVLALTAGVAGVAIAADASPAAAAPVEVAAAEQVLAARVMSPEVVGTFGFTQDEVSSNDEIARNLAEGSRYLCGARASEANGAARAENWVLTVEGAVDRGFSATVQEIAQTDADLARVRDEKSAAAAAQEFEEAARLRDAIVHIKAMLEGSSEDEAMEALRRTARKGSVFGGGRKRQGWKGKH